MKIILDKQQRYQAFEGMGASGAWWAQQAGGWAQPDEESGLPVRDEIARLLYNKTEGIGLRTYRYNLGGGSARSGRGTYSDSDRRAHSFDTPEGGYDFSQDANAVYMMKQAVKEGADEVILFVNSPIEALTKNHMAHLGKKQIMRTNLAPKNYGAFAKYCLDCTEHFLKEGIPVAYLSPVNEPFWIWNGGQEGCHYSPRQVGKVMLTFAREMAKRPALKDVKLSGAENGDIRWFNKSYTRSLLKYPEVRARLDGVDIHSYCLHFPVPFINNRVGFLKRYRRFMDKRYPGVAVKMSEWTHMQGGRDGGMDSALVAANVMWEDISILRVTSWQHWLACSPYDYCDGLLYLDEKAQTFSVTKRYYVTGNFSKYIPYGAVRFAVKTDCDGVRALGFEKGAATVLILINNGGAQTFTLPQGGRAVVTDETRNLAEFDFGAGEAVTLSPHSVTTVILKEESV